MSGAGCTGHSHPDVRIHRLSLLPHSGKCGQTCATSNVPYSTAVSCVSGTCAATSCQNGYLVSAGSCTKKLDLLSDVRHMRTAPAERFADAGSNYRHRTVEQLATVVLRAGLSQPARNAYKVSASPCPSTLAMPSVSR